MNSPITPGGSSLCMGRAGNASSSRSAVWLCRRVLGAGNRVRFQGAAMTPPTGEWEDVMNPTHPQSSPEQKKITYSLSWCLKHVWGRQSTKETERFVHRNLLAERRMGNRKKNRKKWRKRDKKRERKRKWRKIKNRKETQEIRGIEKKEIQKEELRGKGERKTARKQPPQREKR